MGLLEFDKKLEIYLDFFNRVDCTCLSCMALRFKIIGGISFFSFRLNKIFLSTYFDFFVSCLYEKYQFSIT